ARRDLDAGRGGRRADRRTLGRAVEGRTDPRPARRAAAAVEPQIPVGPRDPTGRALRHARRPLVRRALIALALAFATITGAHAQDRDKAPERAPALSAPPGGAASDLPAALAEPEIAVSSAYRGSIIDVWGVNPDRRGRGDVVVAVRGPSQPAILMRKRR